MECEECEEQLILKAHIETLHRCLRKVLLSGIDDMVYLYLDMVLFCDKLFIDMEEDLLYNVKG